MALGEVKMKEWAGDFKMILGLTLDAVVRRASRVAGQAKASTRYMKYLASDIVRGVRSAMVRGAVSVFYYVACSMIVTFMIIAVIFASIATGLTVFLNQMLDAS